MTRTSNQRRQSSGRKKRMGVDVLGGRVCLSERQRQSTGRLDARTDTPQFVCLTSEGLVVSGRLPHDSLVPIRPTGARHPWSEMQEEASLSYFVSFKDRRAG